MPEPSTPESPAVFDLLIRGGVVLDGAGGAGIPADVGIVGDRIAAVGDLSSGAASRVAEAAGLHVAPGFIDIHTHSDISAIYNPGQVSSLAMGVTTQVVGNCGLALGFVTDSPMFEFEKRWLAPHGGRIRWSTFAEYLHLVEDRGIATNFVPLAGHGTLRKRVIGMDERPPDSGEMAQMRAQLSAALESGAWGLSSGLEYPPSSYADRDELADLCQVVADSGGLYATHLRNEGDTLVEAVEEALDVTRRAGVPLQLSHHKAEGTRNWGKIHRTLAMISDARAAGVDVQTDQYPYTAFMTGLAIQTLPRWALSGSAEETAARLTDRGTRARIRQEMLASHPEWAETGGASAWELMRIGVCRGKPAIQGRSIARLATEAGEQPIDFVLNLLLDTTGFVSAVNFAISEEDIADVMRYPWTAIGSDGVAVDPASTASADQVHPRAYGTFPRVLGRYVRELGVLTEAEAIYKMTSLPAQRLGITDRGRIAPGMHADITVYDPAQIIDRATFESPHQLPLGISLVVVNGRIALEDGRPNGSLPGRMLRRS